MKEFDALQYEIDQEFPPEYTDPKYEVADIFKQYGAAYRETHSVGPPLRHAMEAIEEAVAAVYKEMADSGRLETPAPAGLKATG